MPKISEQDISEHMDAWLVEQVPSSIHEGITASQEELTKFIIVKTGIVNPPVRVWVDYQHRYLYTITYSACTDLACRRGAYTINTRFWQPRFGGPLPEK